MPLWNGETWLCEVETCNAVNASIRKRCRCCATPYPGPMNPDPEIERGIQADMRAAVAVDIALGLR